MQATDDIILTSKATVGLAEDIVPVSTFFWYTLRELMLHEAFYEALDQTNTYDYNTLLLPRSYLGPWVCPSMFRGNPKLRTNCQPNRRKTWCLRKTPISNERRMEKLTDQKWWNG